MSNSVLNITPFTKSFVLNTTVRHMQNAVDISTRKTLARLKDFENQGQKGQEILETLSVLAALQNLVTDFKENNQKLFED